MTQRNRFGLSRKYYAETTPSHDPEEEISLEDLSDIPELDCGGSSPPQFHPYPNVSSFRLGDWFWNSGVQKSQADFKRLLDIITDSEFDPADVLHTNWNLIDEQLAADDLGEWVDEDSGWKNTPVTIPVPFHHRRGVPPNPDAGPRNYTVTGFYHRHLVSVIREKLSNPADARLFHYEPYESYWQPTDTSEHIRVHSELYTSPAFVDAHRKLQQSPPEPNCDLQRCVVGLMFWSDATHLTSFGNAKLVPLYLFFGNESKYRRCQPSSHLCEHVAYFQTVRLLSCLNYSMLTISSQLSDAFKDFATSQTAGGKPPNGAFLAHCFRELIHAQWKILLDDDFIEAWKHGIVVHCPDGIWRRFYPRFFTYSADYPEKYDFHLS